MTSKACMHCCWAAWYALHEKRMLLAFALQADWTPAVLCT